jgi:hypothetical protein
MDRCGTARVDGSDIDARDPSAHRKAPLPDNAFHGRGRAKRERSWYTRFAMSRFQRLHDPERPGQVLADAGTPVATVLWSHDFTDRSQTGWFLVMLDEDGEPDADPPRRLDVSQDVDRLAADERLSRADWLAQAATLEMVTAGAAVDAGERLLERIA